MRQLPPCYNPISYSYLEAEALSSYYVHRRRIGGLSGRHLAIGPPARLLLEPPDLAALMANYDGKIASTLLKCHYHGKAQVGKVDQHSISAG